jgi:hypothetical protein
MNSAIGGARGQDCARQCSFAADSPPHSRHIGAFRPEISPELASIRPRNGPKQPESIGLKAAIG